jgi:hypothetical protein
MSFHEDLIVTVFVGMRGYKTIFVAAALEYQVYSTRDHVRVVNNSHVALDLDDSVIAKSSRFAAKHFARRLRPAENRLSYVFQTDAVKLLRLAL